MAADDGRAPASALKQALSFLMLRCWSDCCCRPVRKVDRAPEQPCASSLPPCPPPLAPQVGPQRLTDQKAEVYLLALKFDLLPPAIGLLCLLPCCLGLCATTLVYPYATPALPLCSLGATPLCYSPVATPVLLPLCYLGATPLCYPPVLLPCATPVLPQVPVLSLSYFIIPFTQKLYP